MQEPTEAITLDDLAQLKALADPLRQKLLAAFSGEPKTTVQVAKLLGEKPTKLYHHVDILASAGLLELVETRPKRGTIEHYYRAIASRFELQIRGGSEAEELFGEAFAEAMNAVRAHPQDDPCGEGPVLAKAHIQLTPEAYRRLQTRVADFLGELQECEDDDAQPTTLLFAAYRTPESAP